MQMILVQFWFSSEWVYFAEITIQEAPRPPILGEHDSEAPRIGGWGPLVNLSLEIT